MWSGSAAQACCPYNNDALMDVGRREWVQGIIAVSSSRWHHARQCRQAAAHARAQGYVLQVLRKEGFCVAGQQPNSCVPGMQGEPRSSAGAAARELLVQNRGAPASPTVASNRDPRSRVTAAPAGAAGDAGPEARRSAARSRPGPGPASRSSASLSAAAPDLTRSLPDRRDPARAYPALPERAGVGQQQPVTECTG